MAEPEAQNADYSAEPPVVLITGSARRIGACLARHFHQNNYRIVIHYHHSVADAETLCKELNATRADSAWSISADLNDTASVQQLALRSIQHWGRLDALINNASSFYPTPLPTATEANWLELMGNNLQGPFFLCQAVSQELATRGGVIVNIADIHALQPLSKHSIYCIAKAGNIMMTKALAKDLAPNVRVNGIAPGVILWPENNIPQNSKNNQENILHKIPLNRMGKPEDIAHLAYFLIAKAHYISGQTIAVDGGKHLNL